MNDHQLAVLERQLHNRDPDEAACIWGGDEGKYKEDNGCSYRWQARVVAIDADTAVFDDRSDALVGRVQAAITTSTFGSGKRPWWYAASVPPPTVLGDWCLEGPNRSSHGAPPRQDFRGRAVPDGHNFKTRAYWPYWYNAHHIIPKGTFLKYINGAGRAYQLLRCSLLLARYNINGQRNMLILPMDAEVAKLLDLPRHLRLSGRGTMNHPDYNDFVLDRLKPIIDEYKRICDEAAGEEHDMPEASFTKDQLVALSDELYEEIMTFGRGSAGEPIDDMDLDR